MAEELVFGREKVSSGASSDIQYATKLAGAMVNYWGMSDTLGPVLYGVLEEANSAILRSQDSSNAADSEIKRLVNEAHATATQILTEYRDELEKIAQSLIEFETLTGDEIKGLLAGEAIHRPDSAAVAAKPIRSRMPSSRVVEEEPAAE